MKSLSTWLAATVCLAGAATVQAQDFENELKARQGQFRIMALNLGVLGGMARGNVDYDAETAGLAAENLVAISGLHQGAMWPSGSGTAAIEGTRALPVIWEDNAGFLSAWEDFGTAAEGVLAVAADGQAALGPAVGALGATCGACHDTYRQPSE